MKQIGETVPAPLETSITAMRVHEVALQQWLHANFVVQAGYPIPVVMGAPMDAFSRFDALWAKGDTEQNPFRYLLRLKDANGTPLYEPYPSVQRYPLLTVKRRRWTYKAERSYGSHRWRRIDWPTLSDDVARTDMGWVQQSQMPTAWDLNFQIDHFCNRPDTQAQFVERIMRCFRRAQGKLRTWIWVVYPEPFGTRLVGLILDDDSVQDMTPEEPPAQKQIEFRTSLVVTVEGYSPDPNLNYVPAVWHILNNVQVLSPEELSVIYG